jgi:hypothetical protein
MNQPMPAQAFKPASTPRPYTNDDVEKMKAMRTAGFTVPQIANVMCRTTHSIEAKFMRINFYAREPACPIDLDKVRKSICEGKTYGQIAAENGVTVNSVRDRLDMIDFRNPELDEAQWVKPDGPVFVDAKVMARIIAPIFGAPVGAILGLNRRKEYVMARAVIAKVMTERGKSLNTTARAIGRKDHSTIVNLIAKWPAYCKLSPLPAIAYEKVMLAVRGELVPEWLANGP